MKDNIFLPRFNSLAKDSIGEWLQTLARFFFILTFCLLPVFFIPGVEIGLGFAKTYFVVVGTSITLILLSLTILRRGVVNFHFPLPLVFFWLFVLLALASALLSGDRQDSLWGNSLEVQTVGFFVLMGMVITASLMIGKSKLAITKLFIFSGLISLLLLVIQTLRLFLGPEFLSFNQFLASTSTYVGSFNDLALFSGLVLLVSMILIQGVSFGWLGRVALSLTTILSLLMLAIVNFSFVWLIIGTLSLLMLLYLLSKDTWLRLENEERKNTSPFAVAMILLVVLTSLVFVVGGNNLGSAISKMTGISYLEVRPSFDATMDLVRATYSNNVLLGVGPNRFEDAWRQYKDPIINETNFWSTDFTAGNGFIPTLFVTTGLAGALAIVVFLLAFIYAGYRTLIATKLEDGWHLIGVLTFVSALYLWLIAIVYVPGSFIMLMTALMTGLSLAVYSANNLAKNFSINVVENRQYGLLLIIFVLFVIGFVTFATYNVSRQFLAQTNYFKVVQAFSQNKPLAEIDVMLQSSEQLFGQDMYIAERAKLRLDELNRLLAISEPTVADQQTFQSALMEGIALSEKAISVDSTNPLNYALLASFYGLLDPSQSNEVKDRRDGAMERVKQLDPKNPSYLLLAAQFSARHGDFVSARSHLNEAIKLKNNYTDALFMLSQIDISEGNTDSAIKVTNSMIAIEPFNPTRYFQLGILLATAKDLEGAEKAFKEAIRLDNNYANARYFLALTYLDMDRKDEALTELKFIENTNPDNQGLKDLILAVESGQFTKPESGFEVPVNDGSVVETEEDVTTATEVPDTELLKPVNQVEGGNEELKKQEDNSNEVVE